MASVNDLKTGFHRAMHAMGSYHRLVYTNSREAFLHWYERGMRIFEVDLAETADGKFVCVGHHMAYKDLKRMGIPNIPENSEDLTAEWFLSQKLFPYADGGLTPLSLDDLIDLLKQYDDLIFMLDLFGQFERDTLENFSNWIRQLLGGDVSAMNRLLVETYTEEMTEIILVRIPGVHIIYGIDDLAGQNNCVSVEQIKRMGVEFVSFPWHYHVKYPGKLKELTESGFIVFSRTIDNLKEDMLRGAGVSVVLLDNCHDAARKKNIYVYMYSQELIMSGTLFVQLVNARLMNFFRGIKVRNRRRKT